MIHKFYYRLKNHFIINQGDLFRRIQYRLSLRYTGLLMVLLLLFIFIVYSSLIFVIYTEQKQGILALVNQEVSEHKELLNNLDGKYQFTLTNEGNLKHLRFFYFIVSNNGNLISTDEDFNTIQNKVLHKVYDWKPEHGEVRYISFHVQAPHKDEINLLLAGKVIEENGHEQGILYTGEDVSSYLDVLFNMLIVFLVLSVCFLLIAFYIGHIMSKKAMIPIIHAYNRQRQFVADASHELRTPLSIFYSSLEVIELEDGENISALAKSVLSDLKDECKRMSTLVSDLLTLARSDSDTLELRSEKFNLISEVEQLVRFFKPIALSKMISFDTSMPTSVYFNGDKDRIKQLLFILLDNAIKFTPENGEIQLIIRIEKNGIGDWLQIECHDTGIGIPQEEQKLIFDRFYRVDKHRSRQFGGTGLGLSIAKLIVHAHKGKINVTSTIGEGSTFTIHLPLTY